jgi:hypothetical protein
MQVLAYLIGFTVRNIVRRFGGPNFISFLTLITTRLLSVAALGSRKHMRLMQGIVNRVFGERLCGLLESEMRCAIAQMVITRPKKHLFCPFLLALKKEAKKRIEGEVDAWTAAKIGDAGLVELHVLAIVKEPDCWCNERNDLCDFCRHAPQLAYFCCDLGGPHSDKSVTQIPNLFFKLQSFIVIFAELQRHLLLQLRTVMQWLCDY